MPMTHLQDLQELMSSIRNQRLEDGKKGDALVKQFLSELREAEVKISKGEGSRWNDNHYRLEQGEAGVEVSLHGSGVGSREGWWSVGMNYVNRVERWGGRSGVVFLTPEKRYWVDVCNFFRIAGDETKDGRHHVQLADLEKSPSSVNQFSSVQEFLSISGLR